MELVEKYKIPIAIVAGLSVMGIIIANSNESPSPSEPAKNYPNRFDINTQTNPRSELKSKVIFDNKFTVPDCASYDCDCPDFGGNHAYAQWFHENYDLGDSHRLDRDKDGLACESQ